MSSVAISAAIHGINQSVARDFASTGPTTFFVSRYPISFENCDGESACGGPDGNCTGERGSFGSAFVMRPVDLARLPRVSGEVTFRDRAEVTKCP